jgi:putative endonuclease
MHCTYVLSSEKDKRFYIGTTSDLRNGLKQHTQGRVTSTAYRRPLRLADYEACHSLDDAYRRERYLKSGRGGRYLKQRLSTWLSCIRDNKLERH